MNMVKSKVTLVEALSLLGQNKLSAQHEIEYVSTDKVIATDALKLGSLGIDVPEDKIYYEDEAIDEIDDFEGEWVEIESDIKDYRQNLMVKLKVGHEVEEWLASSNIDIDSLVSELVTGFYKTSKTIRK